MKNSIEGFSRLTKAQKTDWLTTHHFTDAKDAAAILKQYQNPDERLQQLHDEFAENTISNYYLPFSIAPNFLINDKIYTIPMVTEESSVVAAAGKAAKFWSTRGGFKTRVISTVKTGQVHFLYDGEREKLNTFFNRFKPELLQAVEPITKNMRKRGGGVIDVELRNKTAQLKNYYQLHCTFNTSDAMGANFINSCLEKFAETLEKGMLHADIFSPEGAKAIMIMSILSNYVPDCLTHVEVSCKIAELNEDTAIAPEEFAEKFIQAVAVAKAEPYRAVTHNKGIMNGVDAVVLATGNDFRAVEAGVHAYAARNQSYSSLSHAVVKDDTFRFWMEIPLALGTVGGLTKLHPLAALSLNMLGNPDARTLMEIVATAGLAQNFAAIRSLITTGIQKGHMKMHLLNILNQMQASEGEKQQIVHYFKDKKVTHDAVARQLKALRKKK